MLSSSVFAPQCTSGHVAQLYVALCKHSAGSSPSSSCLCCRYVSELFDSVKNSSCSYHPALLLVEQVRLGLVSALWLTSRHRFSGGAGLICMWRVCVRVCVRMDGWVSCQPGDSDPFSVSAWTDSRTQAAVNITHFIFPQQEAQWRFRQRAIFNKRVFPPSVFTDLKAVKLR